MNLSQFPQLYLVTADFYDEQVNCWSFDQQVANPLVAVLVDWRLDGMATARRSSYSEHLFVVDYVVIGEEYLHASLLEQHVRHSTAPAVAGL